MTETEVLIIIFFFFVPSVATLQKHLLLQFP